MHLMNCTSFQEAGEESDDDEVVSEEDDVMDKGNDGGGGEGGDDLQKNRTNSADPPSSVDVMALCIHEKIKTELIGDFASRYPNMPSDTSRCCKRAIGHIAQVESSIIIHIISFGLF